LLQVALESAKWYTKMTTVDLRPFGFECDATIHANIQDSWSGGSHLAVVVGENHKDQDMKRLNLLDACALCDLGVVGCAGVEEPLDNLGRWDAEMIERLSKELFDNHNTDQGVIMYLRVQQPGWYGSFEFGKTLKLLRPSLDVQCVEDPTLHERMKLISDEYDIWALLRGPHPFPGYPEKGDHPHNFLREEAMIANLLRLWDEKQRTAPAALLNTGLAHSRRLAERLRAHGRNYIFLLNPENLASL
jgi:hypothetical protein